MGFETVWFSRKGPKPSADGVKGKVISGKGTRECRCSGSQHGIIRKYGIMMTRRDFREKAETMGWKKYR
eukprot:CAMPEP_0179445736 /NCGR_PEP_ID=MMETSP0799-20121207/29173_1 /TAXON_ID=46947 /ORGANISM="Geminigera cryophila, Strain CCMP2564" /LENGTH=68 /DNA_ID=CAMNT_0021234059 /DNA_START=271 /DNA_END=477 /DNA_ORIENTATION=+